MSQHRRVLGWRRVCYSHSDHHGKSPRHTGTLWSKCLRKINILISSLYMKYVYLCEKADIFPESQTLSCFYAVLIHVVSMNTPVACVRERLMIRLRFSPLSVCS